MELQASEIISLYQLIAEEERAFLEAHQTRVKFFTTIVTAILAATIAGVTKVSVWYYIAILGIGPLLAIAVAWIAIKGTNRLYWRWLWSITIRAKLEQRLGLTEPQHVPVKPGSYWSAEPIVSPKHIESRQKCTTSVEFFERFKHAGYNHWTKCLFLGFICISGILLVAMSWLTVHKLFCP